MTISVKAFASLNFSVFNFQKPSLIQTVVAYLQPDFAKSLTRWEDEDFNRKGLVSPIQIAFLYKFPTKGLDALNRAWKFVRVCYYNNAV